MIQLDPQWLAIARTMIGTKEAPGIANNPKIIGWGNYVGAKTLGVVFNADSTPFCGVFAAYCVKRAGLTPPPIAIRAKSWATWEANLRLEYLAPGAVMVFGRDGGGHVSFYVGEDATHYHVLGSNQSDTTNVMRIARNRLIAARWPRGVPVLGSPVRMANSGAVVSNNER